MLGQGEGEGDDVGDDVGDQDDHDRLIIYSDILEFRMKVLLEQFCDF